jgi:hypothetical protein
MIVKIFFIGERLRSNMSAISSRKGWEPTKFYLISVPSKKICFQILSKIQGAHVTALTPGDRLSMIRRMGINANPASRRHTGHIDMLSGNKMMG